MGGTVNVASGSRVFVDDVEVGEIRDVRTRMIPLTDRELAEAIVVVEGPRPIVTIDLGVAQPMPPRAPAPARNPQHDRNALRDAAAKRRRQVERQAKGMRR